MAKTIDELLALHQKTCDDARSIMRAKNHDYTDGSVDPYSNFRSSEVLGVKAEIGILIRTLDKIKRIQTFVNKGKLQVPGEDVDNAINDSINYLVLVKGLIHSCKGVPAASLLNVETIERYPDLAAKLQASDDYLMS